MRPIMSAKKKIEDVHTMAEAMRQLKSVDVPPIDTSDEGEITFSEATIDDIDIDRANDWWGSWCEIRDIVNENFDTGVGKSGESATLTLGRNWGTMRIETDHIKFEVNLYGSSSIYVIAQYALSENFSDTGREIYSRPTDEIDEVELGRSVAAAEQEILAYATESAAETLDYWHTELDPHMYVSTSQTSWAEIRGVGRQTVSDRVRSAKESFEG